MSLFSTSLSIASLVSPASNRAKTAREKACSNFCRVSSVALNILEVQKNLFPFQKFPCLFSNGANKIDFEEYVQKKNVIAVSQLQKKSIIKNPLTPVQVFVQVGLRIFLGPVLKDGANITRDPRVSLDFVCSLARFGVHPEELLYFGIKP